MPVSQSYHLSEVPLPHVLDLAELIDPVLWGLNRDRIIDTGFRIGPEVRRDLKARAERNKDTIGNVAGSKTQLPRTRAIHSHPQLRRVGDLVQTDVDGPWNSFQPGLDLAGNSIVLRCVSGNLNVDRRRQTKI